MIQIIRSSAWILAPFLCHASVRTHAHARAFVMLIGMLCFPVCLVWIDYSYEFEVILIQDSIKVFHIEEYLPSLCGCHHLSNDG